MLPIEPPAARAFDFPRGVSSTVLLVAHAADRGVPPEQVLAGSGLSVADLADSQHQVTAGQELRVVRNLLHGVDPAGYGTEGRAVGMRYHVSTFGIFGFALLSSVTMLDAVNVALRFWDLSFALALPVVVAEEGRVRISLSTDGVPSDVAAFVHGRDTAAVETVLGELLPGRPPPRFVDGVLEVGLDYLSSPLPQGDARTRAMYEGMCEELVASRRARSGVAQQVRVLITQRLGEGAPMEVVAADLGMTGRTLRRRLASEGASYRTLMEEVRESLATEMLATGRLAVEDVALRLGYAEASSFIAAFRRWTGRTPTAWQRDRG